MLIEMQVPKSSVGLDTSYVGALEHVRAFDSSVRVAV